MSTTENDNPTHCTKCQGTLINTEDHYGTYRRCMTCGAHSQLQHADPEHQNQDPMETPDPNYYQDLGCSISLKCTECPLTACRFEDLNSLRHHRKQLEDLRKLSLIRELDLSPEQAAEKFGINPRTVLRIIQRNAKSQTVKPNQAERRNTKMIDLAIDTYSHPIAAFLRSKGRYGQLSNMTSGYPLKVNELTFQGPEGLYQALKYPHRPQAQLRIAAANSGMQAKKVAYHYTDPRPDWEDIKLTAMAYTLAEKFCQHPAKFTAALQETVNLDIVERSYRDQFWGAIPKGSNLQGTNALGKLLTKLRDFLLQHPDQKHQAVAKFLQGQDLHILVINQKPVVPAKPTTPPAGPQPRNQP